MNLLAFAASHRKESFNRKLAAVASELASAQGAQVDFAEYAELDLPMYNNDRAKSEPLPGALLSLAERMHAAQGIMIATPEYNWSMPGSLKNIIDWLSLIEPNPLAGKTAFLMSASPSLKGGVLGVIHMQLPLQALEVAVYPRFYTLSQARSAFENETIKEGKQMAMLENMIKGYVEFTRALGHA